MVEHQTNLNMKKNHPKPVARLVKKSPVSTKAGKWSRMVEVLTPEQLIEALMPWDGEALFVCVRDENGKVVSIFDVRKYLQGK
jgi:hypothetical protein